MRMKTNDLRKGILILLFSELVLMPLSFYLKFNHTGSQLSPVIWALGAVSLILLFILLIVWLVISLINGNPEKHIKKTGK